MIITSPQGDNIGWIEEMFFQEKKEPEWKWEYVHSPEEKKDSLPVMLRDYQIEGRMQIETYFQSARRLGKSYFAHNELYGKVDKLEQVAKLEEFVRRPLVINPSNWVIEAQRRSELTLPARSARSTYLSRSIMTRSFEHAGMGIYITPSIPTVSGQFKKPEGKLLKQSDKNKYWSEPWTKQRIRLS